MKGRVLIPSEKRFVLNRDGWCCNKCGYVPFHRFDAVPHWAKRSYQELTLFIRDLYSSPPIIIVSQEGLPDNGIGDIKYKLEWLHGGELEFDHIIPIHLGGSFSLDNVQALCHDCHTIKSSAEGRIRRLIRA